MDSKYSLETQREIETLLNELNDWQKFFSITLSYFDEGWALYLREKTLYPRLIVIFKPYLDNNYSINSFEIHFTSDNKEIYKNLYKNENVENVTALLKEFKEILYGKDIISSLLNLNIEKN
ncbi:MAG: hypothetical protein ACFFKA_05090 [Candidatus Thorarchaeota archaeon]